MVVSIGSSPSANCAISIPQRDTFSSPNFKLQPSRNIRQTKTISTCYTSCTSTQPTYLNIVMPDPHCGSRALYFSDIRQLPSPSSYAAISRDVATDKRLLTTLVMSQRKVRRPFRQLPATPKSTALRSKPSWTKSQDNIGRSVVKRHWTSDELIEHRTIQPRERELLTAQKSSTPVLALRLLKYAQIAGRFPRSCFEVPPAASVHLAQQLKIPSDTILSYDWPQCHYP